MAEQQVFPTKGNLILSKKALQLAALGYELLDRKRNILIRELMSLVDKAGELRGSIEETYKEAYQALQLANISIGIVTPYANCIPVETIKETIAKLTDEMLEYASKMEFEQAAELRDKIKEVEKLIQ